MEDTFSAGGLGTPFENAQTQFMSILTALGSERDRQKLVEWVRDMGNQLSASVGVLPSQAEATVEARRRLTAIAEDLRARLPLAAVLPSEDIRPPAGQAEFNPSTTIHLDAFLYDEADEDALVQAGKIPKSACRQCGSQNVQDMTVVTHSCSRNQLEFIFTCLLPELPAHKKVVDVGSRLGAVLYAAYCYTPCQNILGIEMNQDLCDITGTTIAKFHLGNRIQCVNAELSTMPDLVASADVLVLHNVFDWFMPLELQTQIWKFIRTHLKSGCLLVASPAVDESLKPLQTDIDLSSWLRPLNMAHPELASSEEMEDEANATFLYQVI
eukprot:maker-scaffold144_size312663-snap-gene-2.36 protein:Tk07271 transcript:maker-scaffold144_size312663-snap-gene-2.36-mRNA-1 annotation:"hypothetical protein L798_15132"